MAKFRIDGEMPKRPDLNADPGIMSSIEEIRGFEAELKSFFEKYSVDDSFEKLPLVYDPETGNKRLDDGIYLCTCKAKTKAEACGDAVVDLVSLLKKHLSDDGVKIDKIGNRFSGDQIPAKTFVTHMLQNREQAIFRMADENDLDVGLFVFFGILLARPFRMAAATHLTKGLDLSRWTKGYCPVCGHWASYGHIHVEHSNRTLWCRQCGHTWDFARIKCVFCETDVQGNLEMLSLENDNTHCIQVCERCKRYLKETRSEQPAEDFPFDAAFLGTATMDQIGAREGYILDSPIAVKYEENDETRLLLHRQELGNIPLRE